MKHSIEKTLFQLLGAFVPHYVLKGPPINKKELELKHSIEKTLFQLLGSVLWDSFGRPRFIKEKQMKTNEKLFSKSYLESYPVGLKHSIAQTLFQLLGPSSRTTF